MEISNTAIGAIAKETIIFGEIALSGEIRPVGQADSRLKEAQKLGFERIYISKYNKINPKNYKIEIVMVGKIEEVFKKLFAS